MALILFFFSSRRRHTRLTCDWSSDVCSSDLHEQELLARLGVHPAEQQAQAGELLPAVARHLAQERPLAVDDLVVRQRQEEVLGRDVEEIGRASCRGKGSNSVVGDTLVKEKSR